jgi:hypothetical protein
MNKKAYNKSSNGEHNDSGLESFFDGCVNMQYVYIILNP